MAKKRGRKRRAARRRSPRRRASPRRGGGRKPIQRGIVGRLGALLIGVAPPVISGLDAAQRATYIKKARNLSMFGTIHYGFLRFITNLSNGIVGVEPFTKPMDFGQADGGSTSFGVTSGLPKGSLWSVMGTGVVMLGYDWIASKLAGGRPIKIIGTNYNATGGS